MDTRASHTAHLELGMTAAADYHQVEDTACDALCHLYTLYQATHAQPS